jgi:hypothetical protein
VLSQIRLGRMVWYRSKTGTYTCPAIITATVDSIYQPNVDEGHLLPLSSNTHVHLTVFTPGLQGHASDATRKTYPDLVADDRFNKPAGGSFQEFDIPFWDGLGELYQRDVDPSEFEHDMQPAGTWMWPARG